MTKHIEVKLRALMGEWEDDEPVFLGAVSQEHYQAVCEEDRIADGGVDDRWDDLKLEWVERGPAGVGETREVDVTLSVPADLFSTPQLSATTEAPHE